MATNTSSNDPPASRCEALRAGTPDGRFLEFAELEKHYIAQVARLRSTGYAEMFGGNDWFEQVFVPIGFSCGSPSSFRAELKSASPVWVNDGNIPFLIVIPEECAPLAWQASRVMVNELRADTPRFPITRINGATTPKRAPYLIFNVNPGTASWRTSLANTENAITNAHQRGLTFAEGIALLLHYPDTTKCQQGIDENYKEHYAFGRVVFLSARYNGACPADPTAEEFVTFRVRKNAEGRFTRGYYTTTLRRDMAPNIERYIFPSCDIAIAPTKR